jgi:hypothetical protein
LGSLRCCPASSRWQRSGSVEVGDRRVGQAEVDVDRPVPGERFVRSDGVVLGAVVPGVGRQGEAVGDVLAVEPLVLQRLEAAFPDAVLARCPDPGADVVQLRSSGDKRREAGRADGPPLSVTMVTGRIWPVLWSMSCSASATPPASISASPIAASTAATASC